MTIHVTIAMGTNRNPVGKSLKATRLEFRPDGQGGHMWAEVHTSVVPVEHVDQLSLSPGVRWVLEEAAD